MKKPYRSPREVVGEVERVLAARYEPQGPSPLDEVVTLLQEGRHYRWSAIYLNVNGRTVREASAGTATERAGGAEFSVPIRMATRSLGRVDAGADHAGEFSGEDKVLLKEVAGLLARFLTGKGKYLVRRAREAGAESAPKRRQPASDRGIEARRRAAGDGSGQ